MRTKISNANRWLLPAVLILFILEVITFALVPVMAYSGRSENPNHVLTYRVNSLKWDDTTGIDENGVAVLDIFDAEYDGVKSSDGENVVAPGTEGFNIVRLKNEVRGAITYTAVLYRIRDNEQIPVEAALEGDGFTDTTEYLLPEGVLPEHVIRAVTGTLRGKQAQDFDIEWLWEFDEGVDQDVIDTQLGDDAAALSEEQVLVGLYIVVEDRNDYTDWSDNIPGKKPTTASKESMSAEEPGDSAEGSMVPGQSEEWEDEGYHLTVLPKTGDDSPVGMYLALLGISGILLIILLWDRRREKECEE